MGLPKTVLSEEEYLRFERTAQERHQYIDGEIFAMAGESGPHADISTNILVSLGNQLHESRCRVRGANTKIRSGPLPKARKQPSGLYSYPDAVVICDEPEYLDEHFDVVLNPTVIVEVLSPSTEAFDRGAKFIRYQTYNPSLTDYLLVSQDQPQLEHFQRNSEGTWTYQRYEGLTAIVEIASIRCRLTLAEVYHRVVFEARDES